MCAGGGDERKQRRAAVSWYASADARDGNSGDGLWNVCCWWRGEEQFVVFASVECGFECCLWREAAGEWVDGQSRLVDFGVDGGGAADVGEVGGQAVAQVDAGCGELACEQCTSLREAWRGIEMWVG